MTSLLPPSSTALERAIEAATARLGDVPVPLRALYNPDTCPIELLPYLAWALSIDTWSSDWPEPVKRARVRAAIPIQRQKGTAQSVRDVLDLSNGSITLQEWWQQNPPGQPYTFTATLDLATFVGGPPSAAFVDQIIQDITRTKPVRSHFTFTLKAKARGRIGAIGAARPVIYQRLTATASAPANVLISASDARVLFSPIDGRIFVRAAQ